MYMEDLASAVSVRTALPNTQTEQPQHLFIIYIPIQDDDYKMHMVEKKTP